MSRSHKYIRRERVGNRWRYYYPGDKSKPSGGSLHDKLEEQISEYEGYSFLTPAQRRRLTAEAMHQHHQSKINDGSGGVDFDYLTDAIRADSRPHSRRRHDSGQTTQAQIRREDEDPNRPHSRRRHSSGRATYAFKRR